jgi:hypothetical protein
MVLSAETLRKENTDFLFEEGISKVPTLPLTQSPGMRRVRRVAQRAVALYALLHGVYQEAKPRELVTWLKRQGLWKLVLPDEQAFLLNPRPTEVQADEMSWRIERLYVMLWVLRRVDDLDMPRLTASLEAVDDLPIPLNDTDSWINDSFFRDQTEIWYEYDLHLLCQAIVDKGGRGPTPGDLYPDVVHERVKAFQEMMVSAKGAKDDDDDDED